MTITIKAARELTPDTFTCPVEVVGDGPALEDLADDLCETFAVYVNRTGTGNGWHTAMGLAGVDSVTITRPLTR